MKNLNNKLVVSFLCVLGIISCLNAQPQKTWQWVNLLGGKAWDVTSGLACDDKNNLYITGSFSDTLFSESDKIGSYGGQDIFIARYNEKGNITDLIHGGGKGNDQATCIAVTKDNDILLGGSITDDVTFEPVTSKALGKRLFISSLNHKSKVNWISTIDTKGEASLFLLDACDNGKIFAAGVFSGSLAVNDTTVNSKGEKDIFIVRIGSTGAIEKIIAFGGEKDDLPTAFMANDSGMVFIAGTLTEAFSVDSIEINNATDKSKSNAFIIRLNSSLNALWKTQLSGEEFARITALKEDRSSNLYASGSFSMDISMEDTTLTSVGYTDALLLKYNTEGKRLFVKSFGTWYYDYANNLIPDNIGGVIVTGSLGDTLLIDNLKIMPQSDNSALAVQFSKDGKAIWADCISGKGRNFSDAAIIDKKGNLYLSGSFRNSFEKETESITSKGDQDIFVAKYYNCPEVENAISGNPFICPGTTTELNVKPEYNHIAWNDSVFDAYALAVTKPGIYHVAMYDKHGCLVSDTINVNLVRQSVFSLGNDASLPVESSLTLKAPENFKNYRWQDNSSEPTFVAQTENKIPGKYLYWLTASDSIGCLATDTIIIDFYKTVGWIDPETIRISYYPNPVNEWLTWSVNTKGPCQLNLEITSDNGIPVSIEHIGYYEPGAEMKLNFARFPSGVYYLQIKDGAGHGSKTVCVVKQ